MRTGIVSGGATTSQSSDHVGEIAAADWSPISAWHLAHMEASLCGRWVAVPRDGWIAGPRTRAYCRGLRLTTEDSGSPSPFPKSTMFLRPPATSVASHITRLLGVFWRGAPWTLAALQPVANAGSCQAEIPVARAPTADGASRGRHFPPPAAGGAAHRLGGGGRTGPRIRARHALRVSRGMYPAGCLYAPDAPL
jgi:hypothetical protein